MKRGKYVKLTRETIPGGHVTPYPYDVWLDLNEIVHMEREGAPKTKLLLPDHNTPFTHISLKNSRAMDVSETPEEILDLIEKYYTGDSE